MTDERRAEIEAVARFADHGTLWLERMRHSWAENVIAALDRVRDARGDDEACPACGHEWRRHDPEDGLCDAHSAEPGVFGPCRCGRDAAFTAAANARLSHRALAARSPQGEDHGDDEVTLEQARQAAEMARGGGVMRRRAIRPEQPPPDRLGGQPPTQPKEGT